MPSSAADSRRARSRPDGHPPPNYPDGGVGLTDALQMVDAPNSWTGSPTQQGDEPPAGRRLGARVEPGVWKTRPCCGDLAALVWGSDGEVAGFDCRGGCGLTDAQVGELPQRRRWEES